MLHLHKTLLAAAMATLVSFSAAVTAPANAVSADKLKQEATAVAQPAGLSQNSHLNNTDARILLRLEFEALKKAVMSRDALETRNHLTNAITFRHYRYQLYPDAVKTESEAELSQGLMAYNDLEAMNKKTHEIAPHMVITLNKLLADGNFADYFATQTVPMYGYVMKQANKNWQKDIKTLTTFTELVISEINLKIPKDVKSTSKRLERIYGGPGITASENARATSAGK